MGTMHTIDTAGAPRRAGDARTGVFASDLDLPSWEEFADARERFFANLAATAPLPRATRRPAAADPVITTR